MVAGTLYTYPDSFRGLKSKVVAKYSGFNLKVVEVNDDDDKKYVKVPSFTTDDGKLTLFESNAIAYYVSNDQLKGTTNEQRAEVLQWLEYGNTDVQSASATWVFPLLNLVDYNKSSVDRAKEDTRAVLNVLNSHLKTRTYLVGERLTLADLAVAADLILLYQYVLDDKTREQYVNTNRWFTTVVNQQHFKSVLGEFKLCEKQLEYNPKAIKQQQAEKPVAKKEEKKAEKKEEKKVEKKEEKKKEVKAAEEEEEEDPALQEPKSNDPFANYPKSTFNLDEFKRTYSNKELSVSLPYLWENFDRENFSFWFCEYKYPEELTQVFMSSNLIGGMYQRIERLRKHAFASMCVWGANGKNTIAGVWFWKGHDLVFPLCPDWTTDYESFTWRKMNLDEESERKLVDQVFSWEGELNGKKFADGKIFK